MYYLLLRDLDERARFIRLMAEAGIGAVFHYVPLHLSPAGKRYGRSGTPMTITEDVAERVVRLPLWVGLEAEQDGVIALALRVLDSTP
jgi:dTDP-4-amino-4,6-dideoxygalactose transaminase